MHKFFYNGVQVGNYDTYEQMSRSLNEEIAHIPVKGKHVTIKTEWDDHGYATAHLRVEDRNA